MSDRTTLLFALPHYRVLDVTPEPGGGRRVLVESILAQGGCPACGVLSGVIRDRPVSRVKDLPQGLVPLLVFVRKRRFACTQVLCERRSFTETSVQLPARARVTTRLKVKVCAAVTTTNRAVSEVARDHGIAWGTVHRVLVKAAAELLGQATPTSMIGIDETRTRSVRWISEGIEQKVTWRRSDPWMTSIVDLDRSHPGGSSAWPRVAQGPASRAGLPCRAASSARQCASWRSTRAPRTPPGSEGPCRTPGSCWTTSTSSCSATPWSPTSGNASYASSSGGAA